MGASYQIFVRRKAGREEGRKRKRQQEYLCLSNFGWYSRSQPESLYTIFIFLLSTYLDCISQAPCRGGKPCDENGKGWRLMWHMAPPGLALYSFPHSLCPRPSLSCGGCWPAPGDPLMDSQGLDTGASSCSPSNCTNPAPNSSRLWCGPETNLYCVLGLFVLAVRLNQFMVWKRQDKAVITFCL